MGVKTADFRILETKKKKPLKGILHFYRYRSLKICTMRKIKKLKNSRQNKRQNNKETGENILPLFHNISNGKTRLGEEILGKNIVI